MFSITAIRSRVFCFVLGLCLVFGAGVTSAQESASPAPGDSTQTSSVADSSIRLDATIAPIFEEIDLRLDPEQTSYTGTVRIHLKPKQERDHFQLHAEDMEFKKVELEGPTGMIPVSYKMRDDKRVDFKAAAALEPTGEYTLSIDFAQEFDTTARGLYRLVTDGKAYLFTQFEAIDARQAFPCYDEPSFKIPWQMTISVPEGQKVFANTPIEHESTKDGWRTVNFAVTKPMPSYLLALAAGPLETTDIPGLGVPGRVITVAGKSGLVGEAVRMAPPLLKALEKYFDEPYPYAKLDLVAVPEFWAGAMENVGFITFRETVLLLDPKEDTIAQKRGMASTMTHEMAHMWFGDKVTMDWWDDLWLNESFATWLGNKITDQVFPEYSIAVTNVRAVEGAMATDAQQSARAIRQPVTNEVQLLQAADGLTYQKGMAVLGMFENWMGEDLFRKTILAYVKENAWGNAVAADLWSSMSEASGVDVGTAMSTFLDQPGVPLLSVNDLGDGKIALHQERFTNYGARSNKMAQSWQLPVVLRYSDGKQVRTLRTLLSSSDETLDLPTKGKLQWIHPNDDERGYYHWDVDPQILSRLSKDAVEIMNPRERVAFVGQVSALLDAGRLDGGSYLKVIANLADDPRPEVISAMTGAMAKVRVAFVTPELEDAFAAYVSKMLGPARERFGLRPKKGESDAAALLRPSLIGWLGKYAHDEEVVAYAKSVTEAYLDGQGTPDPSVLGQCMQIAALDGGWRLYNKYKKGFEEAKVPAERARFLAGLGWFTEPAMIQHALYYSLHGDLRPQEIFTIPMGIGRNGDEESTKILWDWMTDNYDELMKKMPPMFAVYMPYFAGGCSADRLEAARLFFAEDGPHYVAGQEKELAKVAEAVGDCVGLREREGKAVREYLNQVAGL